MKYYRMISISLAVIFALVGLVFLFLPEGVLSFFNKLSAPLGMKQSPMQGYIFYLILAAAYMYLVTLLAFWMYKKPDNQYFPLLLANGKLASSALSLGFFIFHQPYLINLTNFIVDGLIGLLALFFYSKIKSGK
ncbi:hypothetical protein JXQ31_13430 [candidate division KSB1 bacterium]|nr:hypothetical protein [candidate division KSB1 bacterium]